MRLDKFRMKRTMPAPDMKTTIIALAAMAAPLMMAQEAAPATPAAPAAETPAVDQAEYAKYQAPARETINAMKQIIEVLQGVNSKETADAAAPKVKELIEKMNTLKAASEGLPEPSEAIQAQLKAEFETELQGILQGMMGTFMPIAMNQCYGSEALMEALAPMLGGGEAEPETAPAEPAEAPAPAQK